MAETNKQGEKQRTKIYTTKIIEEMIADLNKGYDISMDPFYMNDLNFRAPNLLFQLTDEEKEIYYKCSEDPEFFIENYCKFQTDHGRSTIKLRKYQKKFVHLLCDEHYDEDLTEFVPDHRYVISMQSRQMGKTTTTAGAYVWYMCFHTERNLFCVANKDSTAKELVDKITQMVKGLPFFLKPGIVKKNEHQLKFDNGCFLQSAATSKTPATGLTIHIMYIDEAALIPNNVIDDFWKSVFPTLSSSKVSKIILTSTPRGRQNLFYRLWDKSHKGENSFVTFRADWWENPDHDDAWAKKQRADFGEEEFAQEFELQWDSAASKLIKGSDFKFMKRISSDYIYKDIPTIPEKLNRNFYWRKDFDPCSTDVYNDKFFITIDTAEGKDIFGKNLNDSDYNVAVIFKMELRSPGKIKQFMIDNKIDIMDCFRFRQVGVYIDNDNDEQYMARALKYLVYYTFKSGKGMIDNVRMLAEMNFNGKSFLDLFMNDNNWYDELMLKTYHVKPVPGKVERKKFGFKTTGGETGKNYYCELGARMITKRQIIIDQTNKNDNMSSIAELNAFDKVKKVITYTYKGVGLHDDLAYAILNCSRATEISEFRDWLLEYFEYGNIPESKRKKEVSQLLKIAIESDENEMSDNEFTASYTSGYKPGQFNNFNINSISQFNNTQIANPYLKQSIESPYSNSSVINPYLNK